MTATISSLTESTTPPKAFAERSQPQITIRSLKKSFHGAPLYNGLDLDFTKGRITAIFGPNGCGKSTLINMVSGLIPIDSGSILFDGKTLQETTIGYVFQNYRDALYPWMRAIDNIKYPLIIKKWQKERIEKRIETLIESFDVAFDLNAYPYELSGGQQQLVSIMRALAPEPEVLFLDEPFSALDYEMTLFIREKLQEIFRLTEVTMVLVSHDLEEAVYMADEILLLSKRPTRIVEKVPFTADRPRRTATLSTKEFVDTKALCLDIFQEEVKR